MHDVAVTLDSHHLSDTHRAEIRDAANIVARKIDKHDVFGAFLWIDQEFGGIAFILRHSCPAAARSCDRTNVDRVADKPHVHFRRAADKREIIAELEAKHVRRRIDEAQTPVKIERVTVEISFEALREDNLENVAGADVFLGLLHCALELIGAEGTASRLHFSLFSENERKISRLRELAHERANRFGRSRVNVFRRALFKKCVHHDFQAAQAMVENEQAPGNHEEHLGQMQIVTLRDRNFRFEEIDRFVAEKSDSAAGEPWHFRKRDNLVTRHQFADFIKRIGHRLKTMLASLVYNLDLTTVTADDEARVAPDERESSRDVIFFCRLKQKTVTAALKFFECGDGRFAVGDELGENGNHVAAFGEPNELASGRCQLRCHSV